MLWRWERIATRSTTRAHFPRRRVSVNYHATQIHSHEPPKSPVMPDTFDAYRERLVVETTTIWPDEYDHIEPADRARIATALHAKPEQASHLEYVRIHTGFTRQITVTAADMARVG